MMRALNIKSVNLTYMIQLRMYNILNMSEWKPISHDGVKKVQYVE